MLGRNTQRDPGRQGAGVRFVVVGAGRSTAGTFVVVVGAGAVVGSGGALRIAVDGAGLDGAVEAGVESAGTTAALEGVVARSAAVGGVDAGRGDGPPHRLTATAIEVPHRTAAAIRAPIRAE